MLDNFTYGGETNGVRGTWCMMYFLLHAIVLIVTTNASQLYAISKGVIVTTTALQCARAFILEEFIRYNSYVK